MIGSGLKKLAASHNMKVAQGVAYGSLYGYAATLSDGAGFKLIQLTTTFPDKQKQFELQTLLNGHNLMKEYRVQELNFGPDFVAIAFHDNPGTMKKILAFIEWFFPLLEMHGATRANICTECGYEIIDGCWKLINGTAYYMHTGCAGSVQREIEERSETRKHEDTGSYAAGLLGAILGALLGAILWAIVLSIGYVASIVGFVIGWLAEKGYNMLHGKQGKGKIVILILAVVFGVFAGTMIGETISLVSTIRNGELPGFAYSDIPWMFSVLFKDSQYITAVLANVAMGLLFAGLGIFSLIRRAGKEVSGVKMKDLQ